MDVILDNAAIQRILPHRYPFLLVDAVVELEQGVRAVGVKNVTANEPFFQGHFPGRPTMPGVLLVEAMAQTAALMIGEEGAGQVPLFMGIDKARFRRQVVPGDQLMIEAAVTQQRGKVVKVKATTRVEGGVAAEAEIMATLVDRKDLD